ncbi:MAG: hypothetical protein KA712_07415 [Myxococcales bacterium]|nr:hypothetical protein [Myxococcales bacterium]
MSPSERMKSLLVTLSMTALAAMGTPAFAQGKVERKRDELLDKLGLDKAKSPPKPQPTEEAESSEAPQPSPSAQDTPSPLPASAQAPAEPGTATKPQVPSFRRQIHPWLLKSCKACHQAGGPAGTTKLVLSGAAARDHVAVAGLVNNENPARSALVQEATGKNHGGGAIAKASSPEIRRLIAWITAGAPASDEQAARVPAPAVPSPSEPAKRRPRKPRDSSAPHLPPEAEAEGEAAPEATPLGTEEQAVTDLVAPKPDAPPAEAAKPEGVAYSVTVHAHLQKSCASCHGPGGFAAGTRLRLTGNEERDYATARALVEPGHPERSLLLDKAAGAAHPPVLSKASDGYRALAGWIAAGAQGPFTAAPPEAAPTLSEAPLGPLPSAPPADLPPPLATSPAAPAHAGGPHHGPHGVHGGVGLPLGMRLNGRFDMNFERRATSNHPFSSGNSAFQNYHHFLFLSRGDGPDPVSFTVELVDLLFWEAAFRLSPREASWGLRLKMGKLLVPFGAEPLFHQSYGGLQGFDQRVLPVVFTQHGFGLQYTATVKEVAVMADLYAVRGYGLRQQEGILNLQNDFSPTDDAQPAFGLRASVSWRALNGHYSLLGNRLGYDRTLVMQALDLNTWRWRGVPVLERFTFGLGFLRADVSGGGAGSDYYHFASYYVARFYLSDTLYFQYRQGLRTFNNRRGFIQDDTRFTEADGSTHNVGLVWRTHGLTVGAFQFWQMEKANEVRDDFFRFVVAYEF